MEWEWLLRIAAAGAISNGNKAIIVL